MWLLSQDSQLFSQNMSIKNLYFQMSIVSQAPWFKQLLTVLMKGLSLCNKVFLIKFINIH